MALGLCFRCNDKWSQGHKCTKALHTMEGDEEVDLDAQYGQEMLDQNGREEEGLEREEEEVILGTLSDTSKEGRHKTLQYQADIGNFHICLLMDTGASHSFINPNSVQSPQLLPTQATTLQVRSAGGEKLESRNMCRNVQFSIQGYPFEADLRVMEVLGYDIVLGVDWIAEMDKIELILKKGLVVVENKGKRVNLLAEKVDAAVQVLEGTINVLREIKEGNQVYLTQVCKIEEKEEGKKQAVEVHPSLAAVLDQFPAIFSEPTQLPPHKSIDHQITLKPGSQPINIRPYRFSYFQKTEIEKITQELVPIQPLYS